jgi:hypothetical protein
MYVFPGSAIPAFIRHVTIEMLLQRVENIANKKVRLGKYLVKTRKGIHAKSWEPWFIIFIFPAWTQTLSNIRMYIYYILHATLYRSICCIIRLSSYHTSTCNVRYWNDRWEDLVGSSRGLVKIIQIYLELLGRTTKDVSHDSLWLGRDSNGATPK